MLRKLIIDQVLKKSGDHHCTELFY